MTPARLQKIEELFHAAVAQLHDQRDAFLDATCSGDESLRKEVEALLEADNEPDEFAQVAKGVAADWTAANDHPDLVGETFGHYRIIAPLAAGGMGEVFLAEDLTLQRKAAIKFLPRRFTRDDDRLRRFEQEARAASALNHPNIITIYEIGEWDGTHFMASEFIEGETLIEKTEDSRLALAQVLDIGCQAAGALAAAHAAGIVHRDIKPANIMLRSDGYLKVLDFGLAKLAAATDAKQLDATEPGRVMGTVNYMSPEQALGQPLDHRTDIFSLGVVLYELATGRRLFAGGSEAATYQRILNQEPPPMHSVDPALPGEFDLVVRRALEKDPARRYQSATDLREDLRRLASGGDETEAAKLASRCERTKRRSRNVRWAAVALLVVGLVAGIFFIAQHTVERRTGPRPNEIPNKSIAVLPFQNASPDDDGTFADGVQDQILNDLAQLPGLKVIGQASVTRYPAGAARDLRAISEQLRVAHILEGQVERTGEKVRVHAQLRNARSNTQTWSQTYERELSDVFTIESEIAQAIARQLRATLSPAEKSEIERAPTRDLSAFQFYTRGRALLDEARTGNDAEKNFVAGIESLNEAIRRDPQFLVAYCQLARAHASIVLYGIDNTPARLAAAKSAAETARRLSPDSGDTHLALANVFYAGYQYDRAREALEIARRLVPNDPRMTLFSAFLHRRQGRWQESTRAFERALELDPFNADLLQDLASNYDALRRYDEWAAVLDRAIALRPDRIGLLLVRALVPLGEHADTRPMRAVLDAKMKEDPASARAQMDWRLKLTFAERDFAAIADALADLGDRRYGDDWARFSREFGEGLLARMTGDEVASAPGLRRRSHFAARACGSATGLRSCRVRPGPDRSRAREQGGSVAPRPPRSRAAPDGERCHPRSPHDRAARDHGRLGR